MKKSAAAARALIPNFLRAFYDKHEVWPSIEDVAKFLKRHKTTASFHLNKLRAEGKVVLLRHGWKAT